MDECKPLGIGGVADTNVRVVALGTGTKCLGAGARCTRGEALADSHAEVVARRALVLFLHRELRRLTAATTGVAGGCAGAGGNEGPGPAGGGDGGETNGSGRGLHSVSFELNLRIFGTHRSR